MSMRYFAGLSWAPRRGARPYLGAIWHPDNRRRTAGVGGAVVLAVLLVLLLMAL
jgi:hypothetical protein